MKTFRELMVWQKAHKLVLKVYETTKLFPEEEKYCLVQQIRRSASSVAANIVEGHKRKTDKEFARFLNISDSSLEETKYHLLLVKDLGYISIDKHNEIEGMCIEVGKMISGFFKKLTAES